MANNYSQATLTPSCLHLTPDQETWLAASGASIEPSEEKGRKGTYVFWRMWFNEAPDYDGFLSQVELEDEQEIEKEAKRLEALGGIENVLRSILKNPENRHIEKLNIQGAYTCSRMRSDEFGGYALVVTRKEFVWFSTSSLDLKNGQLTYRPKVITFDD